VRLVAGYFDIEKPYFNVESGTNIYRQLGIEKHAGYELSLTGQVTDRLNLVVGGVFMKPEVLGEAVQSGQIGEKPVGQPDIVVRVNADYRFKSVPGLSIDGAVNYTSEKAATSREFAELGGQQLMTKPTTTLDLGLRYRFKAFGDKPATLRALVTNVTDEFAWQTTTAGSLSVSSPRAFQVSLAVDF
jgi:iron complex outermembrane receptor protein